VSAEQALKMALLQERLEAAGWRFSVWPASQVGGWFVTAQSAHATRDFHKETRADALAHALQWADYELAQRLEGAA
jgi:hypothetical protein